MCAYAADNGTDAKPPPLIIATTHPANDPATLLAFFTATGSKAGPHVITYSAFRSDIFQPRSGTRQMRAESSQQQATGSK